MNYISYLKNLITVPFSKKRIVSIKEKSVFDIDYEKLFTGGIRLLVFDVDDTLTGHLDNLPKKSLNLLKRLSQGYSGKNKKFKFKVALLSNCSKRRREYLQGLLKDFDIPIEESSSKPSPRGFIKILKKNKMDSEKAAMIGDRIGTDILGAYNAKFKIRILVKTYAKVFGGSIAPIRLRLMDRLEKKLFN